MHFQDARVLRMGLCNGYILSVSQLIALVSTEDLQGLLAWRTCLGDPASQILRSLSPLPSEGFLVLLTPLAF